MVFAIFVLALCHCLFVSTYGNERPVIGLLTIPCHCDESACAANVTSSISFKPSTFVKADYVGFLEAGGAIVIPLPSDSYDMTYIDSILPKINGVLFTGGSCALESNDTWYNTATHIISYIVNNTKTVDGKMSTIPIWGTCLGFEAIVNYFAGTNVLFESGSNGVNIALPLNFTNYEENIKNSQLFNNTFDNNGIPSELSKLVMKIFEENDYTVNLHDYSVSPTVWSNGKGKYNNLIKNINILATSVDLANEEFVSLIESNPKTTDYRIYASQFHSEIVLFETMDLNNEGPRYFPQVERNFQSIMANGYFTQFFINECRIWNNNSFGTDAINEIKKYSINNFPTAKIGTQYMFPSSNSTRMEY